MRREAAITEMDVVVVVLERDSGGAARTPEVDDFVHIGDAGDLIGELQARAGLIRGRVVEQRSIFGVLGLLVTCAAIDGADVCRAPEDMVLENRVAVGVLNGPRVS